MQFLTWQCRNIHTTEVPVLLHHPFLHYSKNLFVIIKRIEITFLSIAQLVVDPILRTQTFASPYSTISMFPSSLFLFVDSYEMYIFSLWSQEAYQSFWKPILSSPFIPQRNSDTLVPLYISILSVKRRCSKAYVLYYVCFRTFLVQFLLCFLFSVTFCHAVTKFTIQTSRWHTIRSPYIYCYKYE